MNLLKPWLLCLLAALCSCTGYHYVTPLVPVQQFEKPGEIEVKGSWGPYLAGAQVAISPVKHIGMSYCTAIDQRKFVTRGFGLHAYTKLLPEDKKFNLVYQGTLAYNKGQREHGVSNFSSVFVISGRWYRSKYESYTLGNGLYFVIPKIGLRAGVELSISQIRFFELSTTVVTQDFITPGGSNDEYRTNKSHVYTLVSPTYHFSYEPFKRRLKISPFLTVGAGFNFWSEPDIPMFNVATGEQWEERGPSIQPIFVSYSIGFRWNLYNAIKPQIP